MLLKQTLAALALTVGAFGQTPVVPPANIPYGTPISTDAAKKIAAGAIAEAHKNNWAMAVAIVDTGGYLVYFERMQDTQVGSIEVSIEKAKTAALFRRPTKSFQDTVAGGGEGLRILRLTGRSLWKAESRSSWTANLLARSAPPAAVATRTAARPKPGPPR